MDRNQISQIVTNGLADPQQASVPEGLPNYQEGWADQWAEYDPERANRLLDEIGLKWDDNHEYRTFADGSELNLIIHQESTGDSNVGKLEELLKNYYEEIGIKTTIKIVDKSLYHEMSYANELMATTKNVWLIKVPLRPDLIVPYSQGSPWYSEYGVYYASNGEKGIKPEGDILKLQEYWDNLRSSVTQEEIDKWSEEIIKLHQKNQWFLGFTGSLPILIVVNNDMRNVPDGLIDADEFRNLGHARPAQFFKRQ